ncbi:hypothetical protein [Streptomyces sp. NPDC050759]|uniref:hypothetical protein n=1 Tax=Streptomyces sp. NPDC050759 TaxID=3365635 RepID=UPI0037B88BBA
MLPASIPPATLPGLHLTFAPLLIGCWCAGLRVFFSPLRRMRDLDMVEEARPDESAGAGPEAEPATAVT